MEDEGGWGMREERWGMREEGWEMREGGSFDSHCCQA